MKTDLSELPDEEYENVVAAWEEYAGITTAELMERYDAAECQSKEIYAANEGIMNLIQFYYLEDSLEQLREHILLSKDFGKSFTGEDFIWAVDMFIEILATRLELGGELLLHEINLGISWFATEHYGENIYWNMDEIWAYWVGLNKENYFDA